MSGEGETDEAISVNTVLMLPAHHPTLKMKPEMVMRKMVVMPVYWKMSPITAWKAEGVGHTTCRGGRDGGDTGQDRWW